MAYAHEWGAYVLYHYEDFLESEFFQRLIVDPLLEYFIQMGVNETWFRIIVWALLLLWPITIPTAILVVSLYFAYSMFLYLIYLIGGDYYYDYYDY